MRKAPGPLWIEALPKGFEPLWSGFPLSNRGVLSPRLSRASSVPMRCEDRPPNVSAGRRKPWRGGAIGGRIGAPIRPRGKAFEVAARVPAAVWLARCPGPCVENCERRAAIGASRGKRCPAPGDANRAYRKARRVGFDPSLGIFDAEGEPPDGTRQRCHDCACVCLKNRPPKTGKTSRTLHRRL
jgi:hypothetical protein